MINNFSLIVNNFLTLSLKKATRDVYTLLNYLNTITPFDGFYIDYKQLRELSQYKLRVKKIKESVIDLINLGYLKKDIKSKRFFLLDNPNIINKSKVRLNLSDYFNIKSNYDLKVFVFLNKVCFFSEFQYLLFWNRVKKEFGTYKKFYRAIKRINQLSSLSIQILLTKRGVLLDIKRNDYKKFSLPIDHIKQKKGYLNYKQTKQYQDKVANKIKRDRDKKRDKKTTKDRTDNNPITNKAIDKYSFDNPIFTPFKERFKDITLFKNEFISFVEMQQKESDRFYLDFLNGLKERFLTTITTNEIKTDMYLSRFNKYLNRLVI